VDKGSNRPPRLRLRLRLCLRLRLRLRSLQRPHL
jgi:hypothetical protein